MASKLFGVDIDLDLNQLLNSRVENVVVDPAVGNAGRIIYNTVSGRVKYDTGLVWQTIANLNDLTGALQFKGGYNATTNTPNLTSPAPGVVLQGYYYVVTVAGSFFGTALEIGDSMFANVDNPSMLADWTIVQANTTYATETVAGVIKLATQVLTDAGVDDTTVVTPLKLKNTSYLPHKYISGSTTVGAGTPVTFIHNLNNTAPVVSIKHVSSGALIDLAVDNFTANSFDVTKNGASINIIVSAQG